LGLEFILTQVDIEIIIEPFAGTIITERDDKTLKPKVKCIINLQDVCAALPNGVLVTDRPGRVVSCAIFHVPSRGTIFVLPGEPVYRCLIVGEHARLDDMPVNITEGKRLNTIRAAGPDEALRLVPPRRFGLEETVEFINDHELVEVTLASIHA
jgi:predicted membrane GTPase involved in stress response